MNPYTSKCCGQLKKSTRVTEQNRCLQHCEKQSANVYNIVRNNQRMFTTLWGTINQWMFTTLWETINGCLQHCEKQSTNVYNIVRNNQWMFTTLWGTINGCLQHCEKQSQYQHKLWHEHKLILISSLNYIYILYTEEKIVGALIHQQHFDPLFRLSCWGLFKSAKAPSSFLLGT